MWAESSTGPMCVLNMRLNCRGSVHVGPCPQLGQALARSTWSARNRLWQFVHSTSGSVKVATCPDASHTLGDIRIELSSPTMSSRECTSAFHHSFLTLRLSSMPRGPQSQAER